MLLTMQVFHTRLFPARESLDAYLASLARLTQATRAQVAALNVEWYSW